MKKEKETRRLRSSGNPPIVQLVYCIEVYILNVSAKVLKNVWFSYIFIRFNIVFLPNLVFELCSTFGTHRSVNFIFMYKICLVL